MKPIDVQTHYYGPTDTVKVIMTFDVKELAAEAKAKNGTGLGGGPTAEAVSFATDPVQVMFIPYQTAVPPKGWAPNPIAQYVDKVYADYNKQYGKQAAKYPEFWDKITTVKPEDIYGPLHEPTAQVFTADALQKAYDALVKQQAWDFNENYVAPFKMYDPTTEDENAHRAALLRTKIPALDVEVAFPCKGCYSSRNPSSRAKVWTMIQHLNDYHHPNHGLPNAKADPWSRERIANWLDMLDLDFTIPAENPKKEN